MLTIMTKSRFENLESKPTYDAIAWAVENSMPTLDPKFIYSAIEQGVENALFYLMCSVNRVYSI